MHASATVSRRSPSDLLDLTLDEPVDAILCTATFHWIGDHERLFQRLHAALRPGGRLVAQCGGYGNIANVQEAIDAVDHPSLRGWEGPWNFATPAATARRLRPPAFTTSGPGCSRGRSSRRTRASTSPRRFVGSHLDRLPVDERMPFVDDVLAQLGRPVVAPTTCG